MWVARCQLCQRRAAEALCQECWQQIVPLEPAQGRCLLPFDAPEALHPHLAYAAYAPPLKQILFLIKYHGAKPMARSLGRYLGLWYRQNWALPDLIVPVPLHPSRQDQRGFNQAEELARGLGEALRRPCRRLLVRSRPTQALHELTPEERRQELAGAFLLRSDGRSHPHSRILLVDDILTTGQTLLACREALLPYTSKLVSLSLARALKQA